ncbi:hypothetical protein NT6N_30520 [Oceaniferula spumae]|uniref:Uncharacterized protein n=1 Tax=Oceaniferula spumae TaxID=2979115 RepID=A0AAT9FQ39_9BACT
MRPNSLEVYNGGNKAIFLDPTTTYLLHSPLKGIPCDFFLKTPKLIRPEYFVAFL